MQNVIVTVTGTQTDAQGEENHIELITPGRRYQKNGIDYVTYQESAVSGMEKTTTLLKIYTDKLGLIRMGSVEQKQEFCMGYKLMGTYVTPFGVMKLNILTKKLDITMSASLGKIEVAYELEIGGQWQSSNKLSVLIREERKSGY
jgi:uncharacterized beta-barrel protein YwiB (DUF1934 family)